MFSAATNKARLSLEALSEIDAVQNAARPVGSWPVSEYSCFSDDAWIMDGTHHPTQRTVNFATRLPFGTGTLLDPGHEDLLFDTKLVVWNFENTSQSDVRGPRALQFWGNLRPLLGWMLLRQLPDFSFLTRGRLWEDGGLKNDETYIYALLEHMGGDPKEVVDKSARHYLRRLYSVFEARKVHQAFNRPFMPQPAFEDYELTRVSAQLGTKPSEEVRPLPDEIAIPLLNSAYSWLGAPADDIIKATEIWDESSRDKSGTTNARLNGPMVNYHVSRAFSQMTFSKSPETGEPWCKPFFEWEKSTSARPRPVEGGMNRFIHLWRTVQVAALIILQQSSGMRSEELLTIRAGRRKDGTPQCLEARSVASGASTMYVVKAMVNKVNGGVPDEHEFVVGMRPNLPGLASNSVPAVRAIDVLLRLSEPLRRLPGIPSSIKQLMVIRPKKAAGLSTGGKNAIRMQHTGLQVAYREFLRSNCSQALAALPDNSPNLLQDGWLGLWRDTKGAIFCPRMCRKTFANFAYSMMPDLIEEIRIQYGHVSRAMTMRYANNDYQVRQLNEMEAEMATERIVEALSVSSLAGKGSEEIRRRGEWLELKQEFDAAPLEEKRDVVRRFLIRSRRLTDTFVPVFGSAGHSKKVPVVATAISDTGHGCCAAISIVSSEMECRKASGQVSELFNGFGPDFRFRSPSRCSGCKNYLVWNRHHSYWKSRFSAKLQEQRFYEMQGEPKSMYQAVQRSADQARAYLTHIGVTESEIEQIAERADEQALHLHQFQ